MSKGGINIGGNASIEAGGDVVIGDKIVTTTTTTITTGFKQEEDKQKFVQQVEELRKQLRQVKAEIEATDDIDEDEKDAVVTEVMQQVKALKTAKDEAEQMPTEQEPSSEKRDAIEGPLNMACKLLENATKLVNKASNLADKVGPLIKKAATLSECTAFVWFASPIRANTQVRPYVSQAL